MTAITARSTVIRTTDWKRVHIPNTEILSDAVVVLTGFDRRRSSIDLNIEYDADIAETSRLLVAGVSAVPEVHSEPSPYVFARGFDGATYTLSLRWWHDPDLHSESQALDGVVRAVKHTLQDAGIALPPPELMIRERDSRNES